ncbi:hypothetical protein YC2023_075870 [Brassica napus]
MCRDARANAGAAIKSGRTRERQGIGEKDTNCSTSENIERVGSGGKGVAAVTSAIRVRFLLGGTIYIAWVPSKEVKPFFFYQKKKTNKLILI